MHAPATARRRITVVWLIACGLTVASAIVAAVAEGDHHGANAVASLVVLGMGAAKAWLILEEFMEVRTSPPWLRLIARSWLVSLLVAIVILYLQ